MTREGWQAPRCATCGHPQGDHQSGGTYWPHPPRFGFCLDANCECREYVAPVAERQAA